MPSFNTIFRAVVMVAVVAVAVKGWKLYGPTNEQVKTVTAQAIELVKSRLQSQQAATPDPRTEVPPLAAANPIPPTAGNLTPPATLSPAEAPGLLPNAGTVPASPMSLPPITPVTESTGQSTRAGDDRMTGLMSRLQQLGAADTNLAPWGDGGRLYRFSCKAPLAAAPTMTQHFESVANEPTVAVEQVLAKVEAWRVAQRDSLTR
jgi:hypothetical protein